MTTTHPVTYLPEATRPVLLIVARHLRFQNEVLTFVDRPVGSPRLQEIREWDAKIRGSGQIVRHSEVIQFDGLSPTRGSVTNPSFRCATSARRAFSVKVDELTLQKV